MKARYFITATGTDIGKTFISAALTQHVKALGKKVMAYKPVVSGFDPGKLADSDTGMLLEALALPPTQENIERISPWRYAAPLAPSMAAKMEGRSLNFDTLVRWSLTALEGAEDFILMEGVGGVMVPIDDKNTVLDWMAAIGAPALLITGSYLGTISHTLTALTVLKLAGIPVHGLIVNESESSSVSIDATAKEFTNWTDMPIVTVNRRSSKDGWKDVGELGALFK